MITHIDKKEKKIEVSGIVDPIPFSKTLRYSNSEDINISDLSAASDINEVDLLNNLTNRLVKSKNTFTNVGPTLLIVNPYQRDTTVYTPEQIEHFIKEHKEHPPDLRTKCDEPHLYDTVLIGIDRLIKNNMNQAVVISGESGAGKTEAAKNCMNCITYYFKSSSGNKTKISEKILGCNPILEAFGNAKTLRNDNSSRFGKYVTIDIDTQKKKIRGAKIKTYLLEKSRITQLAKGERSFHFFYHLLACNDDALLNSLFLTKDPSKYNYLNVSDCVHINTIDDAKLYKETMECFNLVGFSKEEIDCILKIVSAVLLLGNVKFVDKSGKVEIENKDVVNNICTLLQCDPDEMEKSFTMNIRIVAGNEYPSSVSLPDAISFRDALAKELYNRMFLWIILKLNSIINSKEEGEKKTIESNPDINYMKYIGLLDIFGFECFDVNSLEQLCINYTNEQLQQLYIKDFFESEIEEFKREGLGDKSSLIQYKNNQHIIDLLDLAPNGIFLKLDDCSFQNKPDEYFIDLLKKELMKNKTVKLPRLKKDFKITIFHSAKNVAYDITNFVVKNKDELKNTMIKMMINSKNELMKKMFFDFLDNEEMKKEIEELSKPTLKRVSKFLSGKFRQDIHELITELKSCECSYIRCLKPNEDKAPYTVLPPLLFNQIQYLGIFDTIRVRKEGYPSRKEYKNFNKEYNFIYPDLVKLNESDLKISEKILLRLVPNAEELNKQSTVPLYLFGNSKLYMKQTFNILVEGKKGDIINAKVRAAKIIQASFDFLNKQQRINRITKGTTEFQKFYEVNKFKIAKISKIKKIQKIQALYHAYHLKNHFIKLNNNYDRLQTFLKTFCQQKIYERKLFKVKCLSYRMGVYLKQLKEKRKRQLREIAFNLIKKSVNNIIEIEYNTLWNKVQPFFLCVLARRRNRKIAIEGKKARENYSKIIVMEMFQMKMLFYKINKFREGNKKIRQFSITQLSTRYFIKMRESSFIIQAYLKRYKEMIKSRNEIISQYFSSDIGEKKSNEKLMEKCLFPLFTNIKKLSQSSSSCSLSYAKKKYPKLLSSCVSTKRLHIEQSDNIKKEDEDTNYLVPNYSTYDEGKIKLFAKILAVDSIINLSDLNDNNWHDEYMEIFTSNMKSNSPIQTISIGEGHSLAINSRGKVYTWGWNNKSQCGTISSRSMKSGILPNLSLKTKKNFPNLPLIYHQNIQSLSQNNIGNITIANCGIDFSYVINEQGKVYGFGDNENGELGLGNTFPVYNPTPIPTREKIKDIKSTKEITLILSKEERVYIWFHKFNKASDSNHSFISPLLVNFEKKVSITMISCGFNFAMLLSKHGVVYGVGNNEQGELGLHIKNDEANSNGRNYYYTPEENKILSEGYKEKITNIKCGFKHTIALTSTWRVYTWGNNGYGQLGCGNVENNKIPIGINVDPSSRIIQIAAGFRSSFFMNEKRQIYYCGIVDKDNMSKIPKRFRIGIKSKEIEDDSSFSPVRILTTWSRNMSIFYATVADVRRLKWKIENCSKIGKILTTLAIKWNNDSILCPYVDNISNYFSSGVMKKNSQQ